MIESMSMQIVEEWGKLFRKRPKTTAVASILAMGALVTLAKLSDIQHRNALEKQRQQTLSYTTQLD